MKIYGKSGLKKRLDDITAKGRLSHAVLFSGEAGAGKKTLARYTAELFMCEDRVHPACGECSVCRNIENGVHPDVIFVKERCEGKYSSEALREVLSDTVVRPNNGGVKVYVFEECDTMRPEHQNALLKLIEEPAEYLRFVFTCESTSVVLETILSRVTEFEVPNTPIDECKRALIDGGVDEAKAGELSEMFAGNIAKCKAVLDGGDEAALIETARKAAAALGKRDKLGLAAALSEAQQLKRAAFGQTLSYLSRMIRDALAVKCGGEAEFFGKAESKTIAAAFSEDELLNILDVLFEIAKNEIYNINIALTAAYFTSRIM